MSNSRRYEQVAATFGALEAPRRDGAGERIADVDVCGPGTLFLFEFQSSSSRWLCLRRIESLNSEKDHSLSAESRTANDLTLGGPKHVSQEARWSFREVAFLAWHRVCTQWKRANQQAQVQRAWSDRLPFTCESVPAPSKGLAGRSMGRPKPTSAACGSR
jgi:hypothetical protein